MWLVRQSQLAIGSGGILLSDFLPFTIVGSSQRQTLAFSYESLGHQTQSESAVEGGGVVARARQEARDPLGYTASRTPAGHRRRAISLYNKWDHLITGNF